MNEPSETGEDNENVDYTYGSAIVESKRYSVSNALDVRNVEELLRITRSKSKADDAKAIPAFEEGQALFKEKRYREALRKYIEAAQLGHLKSQRRLGVMYLEGLGCNQDYLSALKWLKIASERNDLHAQEKLAHMHRRGLGVEESIKTAIYWYHRSSELGGVQSTYELATCYERGEGVAQDCDESTRLYMIAAEQGHVDARYHVGVAYELGLGVDKNTQEAIDWYILAIQRTSNDAKSRLWALVDEGIFVPESRDEAKFAEKVGLELNDPVCLFKEAIRKMTGFDSAQDFEYFELNFSQYAEVEIEKGWKSVLWYCYGSARNSSVTRNAFSELEGLLGDLAKSDTKSHWLLTDFYKIQTESIGSFYSLMLSACLGDCYSQYKLGSLFDNGIEFEKDVDKAVFWLKKAAGQGNRDAHRRLGDIYKREKFGKNYKLCCFLSYKEAANLGCPISMFRLALCYRDGDGVDPSREKYLNNITMSANQNLADAMYLLSKWFSEENEDLRFRIGFGRNVEKTQIFENEKLRMYWLNKAIRKRYSLAVIESIRRKEKPLLLEPREFLYFCYDMTREGDYERNMYRYYFELVYGLSLEIFEKYWHEICENNECDWSYEWECFNGKVDGFPLTVDERSLYGIITDYVRLGRDYPVEALVNLILLHSRKRLSEVWESKVLIEKSISEMLESLKHNRGNTDKLSQRINEEIESRCQTGGFFLRWDDDEQFEIDCGDPPYSPEEHFLYSEYLYEVEKLIKWRHKVQGFLKDYDRNNVPEVKQGLISRRGESRRRRIEKKQSKEQAVSDMWYD